MLSSFIASYIVMILFYTFVEQICLFGSKLNEIFLTFRRIHCLAFFLLLLSRFATTFKSVKVASDWDWFLACGCDKGVSVFGAFS